MARLREQAAELERQTREDSLTGLFNRRHLDTLLSAEWERALRFGRALTVAMADIDHFKNVNDRYSHAVGDVVLRTVGRILCENTRGVDTVSLITAAIVPRSVPVPVSLFTPFVRFPAALDRASNASDPPVWCRAASRESLPTLLDPFRG